MSINYPEASSAPTSKGRAAWTNYGRTAGRVVIDSDAAELFYVETGGNLTLVLAGDHIVSVVITNGGGHTVTFDGSPLSIAASGSTVVEFTPLSSGWRVT